MESNHTKYVDARELEAFVNRVFAAAGLPDPDASVAASLMVATNLYGIDSHGVLRLPVYVQRLRAGQIRARPRLRWFGGRGALQALDGDNGLGYVVGAAAMDRAVSLAREHGVGAVAVGHSNHLGAAGLYARKAAEQGMIGVCLSNVQPNMVAPGGAGPVVGNNPLAVAVLGGSDFPLVLDIATSQVAAGKLLLAAKKGQKIPWDWAVDKDGCPTDDPERGFAGYLLPLGGHKGYGLALVIDILCGVLSGSGFLHDVKGMYRDPQEPSRVGHFMLALNYQSVVDQGEWKRRMQRFESIIKSAPMRDPHSELMMPGERAQKTKETRLVDGIPLPDQLFNDLNRLAADLELDLQLAAKDMGV